MRSHSHYYQRNQTLLDTEKADLVEEVYLSQGDYSEGCTANRKIGRDQKFRRRAVDLYREKESRPDFGFPYANTKMLLNR